MFDHLADVLDCVGRADRSDLDRAEGGDAVQLLVVGMMGLVVVGKLGHVRQVHRLELELLEAVGEVAAETIKNSHFNKSSRNQIENSSNLFKQTIQGQQTSTNNTIQTGKNHTHTTNSLNNSAQAETFTLLHPFEQQGRSIGQEHNAAGELEVEQQQPKLQLRERERDGKHMKRRKNNHSEN